MTGHIIWIIGVLFSIGFFSLSEAIEEEKWHFKLFVLFMCLFAWPLLCGKMVGIAVEEVDKEGILRRS